jgi:outer membrane protein
LKAAKYNVNSQTGALLPEVSFTASTGKNKSSTHTGYDPTTQSTEYTVDMSIPLYSGGATRAAIRKSKYQRWAAEENLRAAESNVQLSVTSGWEMMETSKANIVSIREQVKASEVALEGTQKEEDTHICAISNHASKSGESPDNTTR